MQKKPQKKSKKNAKDAKDRLLEMQKECKENAFPSPPPVLAPGTKSQLNPHLHPRQMDREGYVRLQRSAPSSPGSCGAVVRTVLTDHAASRHG